MSDLDRILRDLPPGSHLVTIRAELHLIAYRIAEALDDIAHRQGQRGSVRDQIARELPTTPPEIEDGRDSTLALRALAKGPDSTGRLCWCQAGVDNPMAPNHTAACDKAWSIIGGPWGFKT